MESLKLKRKLPAKDKESELTKKQRLGKSSKKEGVFAVLCSTLSQAVLPTKKSASAVHVSPRAADGNKSTGEENHQEKEPAIGRSCSHNSSNLGQENHIEKEPATSRSCSDCAHSTSENRQLSGEDGPLIPPKSSPEMTVNGS